MNINIANLDSNIENWASIDGYLNYQVSWWGRVVNTTTGRILKGGLDGGGYLKVNLSKDGEVKGHRIHQLVAKEWVSNPGGKRCVDHIDNDRSNNHYGNLRYATHAENIRNSMKTESITSSMYKGVSFHRQAQKWQAQIMVGRLKKHLGLFTIEREAAESYNAAAVRDHKEFAKLNKFED